MSHANGLVQARGGLGVRVLGGTMSKLKPCPFCGGEAEVIHQTTDAWYVLCRGCYMATRVLHTEAEAIEVWNTRSSESQLLAEMQTRVWIAERQRNEAMAALMNEGITVPLERTCRNNDTDDDDFFTCSSCGNSSVTEFLRGGYGEPNYCPNCGAKVVEE